MTPVDAMWVGIDLGTQGVRAVAVDPGGAVVGRGTVRLTSRRDGPVHEQDPEDWWRAAAAACRAALGRLDARAVRGVATCCTSGTIALVDRDGRALTPGVMYDDGRCAAQVERVNAVGAATWASLGYVMQASWGLPKLVWLLERGDVPRAGARLAHQADVVTARLVGRPVATDTSSALKSGYDLLRDRWPRDVLDALGVAASVLPEVVLSGSPLGLVCAGAAAATGLPEGVPVIAGMTDGCAAQIAAGALREGSWNSVLGTTLVLKGVAPEPVRQGGGLLYSHRSPDGGWLPGAASSVGAGAIGARFPGADLEALDAAAAAHEPAGALAYPLVSRGERFPFSAPQAEGFVLGRPAGEADEFAALLQGVAFVERLCFDLLDLLGAPQDGDVRLTGGGARSAYWRQLRADVLGRPLAVPESGEAALGMAILAAAGAGRLAATAAGMVRVREVVAPRAGAWERFRAPYLRLVGELEAREWLPAPLADRARERAAA